MLNTLIDVSNEVYNRLGCGHNEIVYHKAFEVELRLRNISYSTKAPISIMYKDFFVGYSELDIIVNDGNDKIIVELKATAHPIRSVERAQLLCYMNSTGYTKGVLINFTQPSERQSNINNENNNVFVQHCDYGFDVKEESVTNSIPFLDTSN